MWMHDKCHRLHLIGSYYANLSRCTVHIMSSLQIFCYRHSQLWMLQYQHPPLITNMRFQQSSSAVLHPTHGLLILHLVIFQDPSFSPSWVVPEIRIIRLVGLVRRHSTVPSAAQVLFIKSGTRSQKSSTIILSLSVPKGRHTNLLSVHNLTVLFQWNISQHLWKL